MYTNQNNYLQYSCFLSSCHTRNQFFFQFYSFWLILFKYPYCNRIIIIKVITITGCFAMYSITITITCNHKNQRLQITFRLLKTCNRLYVITITDYNYNRSDQHRCNCTSSEILMPASNYWWQHRYNYTSIEVLTSKYRYQHQRHYTSTDVLIPTSNDLYLHRYNYTSIKVLITTSKHWCQQRNTDINIEVLIPAPMSLYQHRSNSTNIELVAPAPKY